MRARVIVFPIKGRTWCFTRSIEPSIPESESAQASPTLRDLWRKISSDGNPMNQNAELVVDFVTDKMNRAWDGLGSAPDGSFKNKIYGLGLRLLAQVEPSELFLKSISKEVTSVEIIFPMSLNQCLVRRRLRHIATRGTIIHRRYFYGSASLLPFTAAFAVLPLPNIPFFWVLFRTYSNWRALQGSERLFLLISDSSRSSNSDNEEGRVTDHDRLESSDYVPLNSPGPPGVLQPSEGLEEFLHDREEGLSEVTISNICKTFHLDTMAVLKYRDLM
ncbi:hypothetical protein GIB67_040767 [Kingdonia uniflora]|uniref:Uncharacterized protein n=1 Tax=Kingdonia uniflora TaxID=39325 RepID=A0A7J7LUV5_9MAGN|nr:hypothetical protein GIB67_040767 [Kingdonia uniflora]